MKYERTWVITDAEGYPNYRNIINFKNEEDMRNFLSASGYDESKLILDKKKSDEKIINNRLICNFELYNFDNRRQLSYKIITNKFTDNYDYKFY
jgi:hypothetical protein